MMETPPRMRGRRTIQRLVHHGVGNTPADAGKTSKVSANLSGGGKHPRGCGEDSKILYVRSYRYPACCTLIKIAEIVWLGAIF